MLIGCSFFVLILGEPHTIIRGGIVKRRVLSLQEERQDIPIMEAFQVFRRTKVNNNLSKRTIKHYDDVMELFGKFFNVNSEVCCSDISRDTIEAFVEFLKSRNPNIKATSINSYLKDLRTILYYFMERGYMKNFSVKLLKEDIELKEIYTSAEINRLLEKPNLKKCDFSEYRNWVITCYLLATGNRLGTVCELRIGDIDFDSNTIHLRKLKTRKAYTIPLSTALEKVLAEYMQYRKGEADEYLFCNKFGDKLQESSLNTAIYRYNRRRGVSKTSVHLYRNTFAKTYITNEGDIARLQKLLGHSTPTMSLRYAKMFDTDLDYHFDERNPLDTHIKNVKKNESIKMSKK